MPQRAKLTGDDEHPGFGQDTGQDADRRLEEASDLLTIIRGCQAYTPTEKETGFLDDMEARIEQYGDRAQVSGKQVMWMRGIRDKAIQS
jgi:hypothetical protein